MTVTFRPATPDEAAYIGSNLRPADRREHSVFTTEFPERSFRRAVESGQQVYAAHVGGNPCVLIGVHPDSGGNGRVWLMSTPDVSQAPVAVLKETRKWRDRWLRRYPKLWNIVDARNRVHVRWIETVGFRLGDEVQVHGHPFIYFDITQETHRVR